MESATVTSSPNELSVAVTTAAVAAAAAIVTADVAAAVIVAAAAAAAAAATVAAASSTSTPLLLLHRPFFPAPFTPFPPPPPLFPLPCRFLTAVGGDDDNGFSCILTCLLRWSLLINFFKHTAQPNRFSPVCVRLCLCSSSDRVKHFPQSSHWQAYGRSPV